MSSKFLKAGKVCLLLQGRHAGTKAVVVKTWENGTHGPAQRNSFAALFASAYTDQPTNWPIAPCGSGAMARFAGVNQKAKWGAALVAGVAKGPLKVTTPCLLCCGQCGPTALF